LIRTHWKHLRSAFVRNVSFMFLGNVSSAGIAFVAVLMITRQLALDQYGLFCMTVPVIVIGSALAALGTDTGIIRFASSYLAAGAVDEAADVCVTTLAARVAAGCVFCVLIVGAAPLLSGRAIQSEQLEHLVRLGGLGVLPLSLVAYTRAVLFAHRRFAGSVLVHVTVDLTKFLLVGAMALASVLNTSNAVGAWALAAVPGAALGLRLIGGKGLAGGRYSGRQLHRLLSYSKWVLVSNMCGRSFPWIGVLMLGAMRGSEAAGIYGLALSLTHIFPIIAASLASVAMPEVSRFTDTSQFEHYVRESLRYSLYASVLIIPLLLLSRPLILLLVGARYVPSIAVFNWLLVSCFVQVVSCPIRAALHALNRPCHVALIDTLCVTIMGIGCYIAIPLFGTVGPAILALVANGVAFWLTIAGVYSRMRAPN